MKIKAKLLFIFLLFRLIGISQSLDTIQYSLLLGIETGGQIFRGKDPNTDEKFKHFILRTAPYVGYYIRKNMILGIKGESEFMKSNYTTIAPLFGIGGFLRHKLPIKFQSSELLQKRLKMYTEIGCFKINSYQTPEQTIVLNHLTETNIRVHFGMNFQLIKGLYLDYAVRYDVFVGRKNSYANRLELEYHFLKNKQ